MNKGCVDKFPLLMDGRPAGELTVEREALYTWFDARCRLPGEGLPGGARGVRRGYAGGLRQRRAGDHFV